MMRKIAGRLKRKVQSAFVPKHQRKLKTFLDAKQKTLGGVGPLNFEAVIRAYCASGHLPFFVQIGAHNGAVDDPMSNCIRAMQLKGILVEPQFLQFSQLTDNYANQPQLILERAAIASADGEATLYKVSAAFWRKHRFPENVQSQISSLDRSQIKRHVELFGDAKLATLEDDYLEMERVPAITLASLLLKYDVKKLDLLQIDAEGFDYEILKMIDWKEIRPSIIQYETIHLPVDDRAASWALLRKQGYHLYASDSFNTVAFYGLEN